MNKKKILIPFILIAAVVNCSAQTNSLSLKDAIAKALSNRLEIKIQHTETKISQNELKKINSRNMPQITSDLDVRYNSRLQTNVIPGNIFSNSGNASDRTVQFGTKYNSFLGFNLSQTIFNPNNLGDKQIAQSQTKYDLLSETKIANDVKQQVTESYFTALLWKEKVKLSISNFERTNEIYNTAKEQLKQGTITSYDILHYELDKENAFSENEKNKNNLNLAVNDLWYKMGEDSATSVVLTDSISGLFSQYKKIEMDGSSIKRPELEMEKQQQQTFQLNIKKQNLTYIPTLSVYGNYTFQYLNNDFKPFTNSYWYPYNYIGIKASIPIFDGLLKERTKSEYKLRMESSKLNYKKLMNDYNQEALKAINTLNNSQTDLEFQNKNLSLANTLYLVDSGKLKNGTIKPNDLATTYYTMQQTQNNYLNAVYNYLIAVIEYKKAIGSL